MKITSYKNCLLYRMVLSFCSISILACVLLTFLTFSTMSSSHHASLTRLTSDMMLLTSDHVGTQLQMASKLCDNLTRNINIQEYLQMKFDDLSEQYSTDLSGSSELMSTVTYDPYLNGVYILGENGGIYKSNIQSLLNNDFRHTKWYQQIITSNTPVWFHSSEGSLMVKTPSGQYDQYLYIGYPFSDKTTGQNIGLVLAEISVKELFPTLTGDWESSCQISLYDLNGESPLPIVEGNEKLTSLLYSSQEEILSSSQEKYMQFSSAQKEIILGKSVPSSPWTIISYIQSSELQSYTPQTLSLLILAVMTVIFISILLALSLSRAIVSPIHELVRKMDDVKNGDFSISVPVESPDEIGLLSESFNHLIAKIRSLIDQIYRDQEKLRIAELSVMQAQINPHFLYNSLDSTIWLLKMNQIPKALKMLQALSTLFRVALSKGRSTIPLRQELQHVKSYLTIQHLRYDQKFDYRLQIDEHALEFEIIKVLIQPLVENSIYHGIREDRKILIEISVKSGGSNIHIQVKDNGIGIPDNKLKILQEQLDHPYELPSHGYGLHNANARIKIFYGKEYGLKIASVYGQGTVVSIEIPQKGGRTTYV